MRAAAVLALVGTLVAACGEPTDGGRRPARDRSPAGTATGETVPSPAASAKAGGTASPCELLTQEEVGMAIGGPVTPGEAMPSACTWRGDPGMPVVSLAVATIPDPRACERAAPPGVEKVGGLGVPAWWEHIQAEVSVGTLLACPPGGQVILTLSGGTAEEPVLRGAALELASSALARR